MTKVTLIKPGDITDTIREEWRTLQAAHRDLASPYFSIEFCQLVGSAREDVQIGVIEHNGNISGFFPFHRKRFGVAAPLAGQISDYHGLIGRAEPNLSPARLLQALGLSCFDFNHIPQSQSLFAQGAFRQTASR